MFSEMGFAVRGSRFAWKAAVVAFAFIGACAYAGTLHDPTRPDFATAATPAHAAPAWQLNSTLISAHRRLAVINGKSVGVGDRIDGATVVAITPGAVRLRRGGHQFTIHLIADTIKTKSAAAAARGSS
ncbi:MAG TPA: MSHA biogenesis protein MshK [Gammaproteobacteria bacterium]|nr:MSHA biogenesis protein MshK [Gammaproteobacteria bacterium]